MATPAPLLGQMLGRYRILEQIGAGGMGCVFRAHDERLDRDVALKVLPSGSLADETSRRRFRKEARVLARLNHANVAMAFDYGREEGIDFIVTEYIPGITLNEKLVPGPLPEKTMLDLGLQLCSGLEAAHNEGIVHRDL